MNITKKQAELFYEIALHINKFFQFEISKKEFVNNIINTLDFDEALDGCIEGVLVDGAYNSPADVLKDKELIKLFNKLYN